MAVRLNITMDEDIYARLKKEVPPKKISVFISSAVRAKLHPDKKALDEAYRAARKERWRKELEDDWNYTEDNPHHARLAALNRAATSSARCL